jgi:hypothetical protein
LVSPADGRPIGRRRGHVCDTCHGEDAEQSRWRQTLANQESRAVAADDRPSSPHQRRREENVEDNNVSSPLWVASTLLYPWCPSAPSRRTAPHPTPSAMCAMWSSGLNGAAHSVQSMHARDGKQASHAAGVPLLHLNLKIKR